MFYHSYSLPLAHYRIINLASINAYVDFGVLYSFPLTYYFILIPKLYSPQEFFFIDDRESSSLSSFRIFWLLLALCFSIYTSELAYLFFTKEKPVSLTLQINLAGVTSLKHSVFQSMNTLHLSIHLELSLSLNFIIFSLEY